MDVTNCTQDQQAGVSVPDIAESVSQAISCLNFCRHKQTAFASHGSRYVTSVSAPRLTAVTPDRVIHKLSTNLFTTGILDNLWIKILAICV